MGIFMTSSTKDCVLACCKHFMLINFSYFQFLFSYLRFLFFFAIRNSYEMKMVLSFMRCISFIFFYKNCSCKFHQLRLHFFQSAKILNIIVAWSYTQYCKVEQSNCINIIRLHCVILILFKDHKYLWIQNKTMRDFALRTEADLCLKNR